jgi:hypothetical protein
MANDHVWIAVTSVVAALGVGIAHLAPTGSGSVDWTMAVIGAGLFVMLVGTTMWTSRWKPGPRRIAIAVVAGIVLQILARLGNVGLFGISALISLVPLLLIALYAIERRTGPRRILLLGLFCAVIAGGFFALVGMGVAVVQARPELTRGTEVAKEALQSLKAGDFVAARRGFRLAADLFKDADHDLNRGWAKPALLVPIVAQHQRAAAKVAKSAGSASTTIASVLGEIDFDQLRVVNGVINIEAIRGLADPLARLTAELDELQSAVSSVDSPWLLGPIRSRLSTLSAQIDDQQIEGERAGIAVERAPALLGADGPRVYFIAFTTPAEARGLGGFMGNWAELTIDQGRLSVTKFGRTADLAVDGDTERWIRVTSSPHFPDVAQQIADGYPAFSGHPVDGVFAMDVYTVAALMKLTGPIDVATIGQTVTTENAAKFLLSDQYALVADRAERIDLLEEVAGTTISRLLTTSLPAPPELLKLLGPFATQGRLVGWSPRFDEEELFGRMRMSGELPPLDGGDGLAVVINNIGNNKIDYYLTGDVNYSVDTDPATGKVKAALDVTLRNGAPAGVTVPPIVFENSEGALPGTSVMMLSVYSALPVLSATIDGQQATIESQPTTQGYRVSMIGVNIAAQSAVKVTMQLSGLLDLADGYHVQLRNQALTSRIDSNVIVEGRPVTKQRTTAAVRTIRA